LHSPWQNSKFIISIYLKVSTKKAKWSKVKAKTVEYFKTRPGVPQIVTSESSVLKLLWTLVILGVFGVGFYIISQAVADFNKFDKITNIERVYPESVTFPAITFCTYEEYSRERYRNGSLIEEDRVYSNILKQFLDFDLSYFYLENGSDLDVNNHLDTFKMKDPVWGIPYDCLRFNAVTNKSVELLKASSIQDSLLINFKKFYREDISDIEYYNYTFNYKFFIVYVVDNSLNSLGNINYLYLDLDSASFDFEIEKVTIETELPEPYNPCKKSSVDEPYHQMDCIGACTYKEIKNKYNCTFQETLFSIQGFRQCEDLVTGNLKGYRKLDYRKPEAEFSASCLKECPFESCFSEKFTFDVTKSGPKSDNTNFFFKFRDLSTLNISQIPKTDPFTFLNNIGGGLGLFMGIAFPNLVEFFQFILEIILILFIKKTN